MREVVIVSAVRTPVGKFLGALSSLTAVELGAIAIRAAVERVNVAATNRLALGDIDECIMGCVLPAGLGQNPARQAALRGGLADSVSALTINMVCGSGLRAVGLAAQSIAQGNSEIAVAGGMESMSNAPYLLPSARKGMRMGDSAAVDSMIRDGLWCACEDFHMGETAEFVTTSPASSRMSTRSTLIEKPLPHGTRVASTPKSSPSKFRARREARPSRAMRASVTTPASKRSAHSNLPSAKTAQSPPATHPA
jgi:acetyl-CoA C-acetyltransferase